MLIRQNLQTDVRGGGVQSYVGAIVELDDGIKQALIHYSSTG